MKRKTILISVLILVVLLLAGFFYYRYQNKAPVYYWRSVTIDQGDVHVLVTATGTIAADTSVDVGVQVSCTISKIKADFNDVVKKGQVIAVLDTTLYYAAKLDVIAFLHRTEIALAQSKTEYDRAKNLYDHAVISKSEFDLTFTAYENAKGNVLSAQAQLKRAAINLAYCRITAPISGIIISRNVQVGNMVIASFNSPVLFNIVNTLATMQMQANVDEADIGQLRMGQRATFTVDAYPNDVFKGVVTQIRRQPILVQNVVNYVVIIEVKNPDKKLMPGLTANANIFIQESKGVMKVATNAFNFIPPIVYIQASILLPDSIKQFWTNKLRKTSEIKKQEIVEVDGTTGFLWLVKGKEVLPIQVSKGLNDGSFTEINGTVKVGDTVATGINTAAPSSDKPAKSPFMPSFPSRKK